MAEHNLREAREYMELIETSLEYVNQTMREVVIFKPDRIRRNQIIETCRRIGELATTNEG